ncbi:hypothetical protein GPL15_06270 [Clostridium sp. MCC353]|uniref:hypothetical protein n=1 Tax=Clostridium sp. MCC353 TaxID=2592646 RepID=UPI001C02F583|nr:hypothetical protein [Clostridium sp. MCC353]MBT9776109.1 hypothetical protein [Clostridium sp. MCC353]
MVQPITDYAEFLRDAKADVLRMAQLTGQEEQLRQEEYRLERSVEAEKKSVSESINYTIKKRTEALNASYDQEIGKGQERLKKARAKREKAKNQGIKERIAEETSELREENRELNLRLKTLFQKNHVPGICRGNWYYALFLPRWFGEYLRLLCTVLVCFLAVPYGTYLLIGQKKPLVLAAIYFVTVLVFGGLYVFVSNKTKIPHLEALRDGQMIRDQIHGNNKKIKVITHTIQKDRNDAVYDLQIYDDEIAQLEQELSVTASKKKDALNTFETVTKNIIADEITNNSKEKIESMEADLDVLKRRLKEVETARNEKCLYVTEHYEPYLGKEFLIPSKLDQLLEKIVSGSASNLSEAMDMCREVK